jgi:hypothetical protein
MPYPFAFNVDKVLGGSGNTVTHNYAAVFGCNVASVMNNAVHANNFVAQNVPLTSGGAPVGLPAGTFYADDTTTPGTCYVMIA